MRTENVKVAIPKNERFIFLVLFMSELTYFISSLTTMLPLLRAIVAFPSLFVLPGMMLLVVMRDGACDMVRLVVEGFFTSTLISVVLTSLMLMFGLPIIPFTYSSVMLILVSLFAVIALARKIKLKPSKLDTALIAAAFLLYVVLLLHFSKLPRFFAPDETSYIFSARMGILNGAVPPMGVMPNKNEITAVFQGRLFWIYLIISFIGSTRLPAYQAGLLGVSFLTMTALASSLLVKNKWLRTVVFATVAVNPLLFSFSALTLNDLAVSFYIVFAILFFVDAFSKANGKVSISIRSLFSSLLAVVITALIKPNLLFFVVMWVILVYIMLRYKLYKLNFKYKILLATILTPVLMYELCVDIPYVISVWMLRSELGSLFGKFLFMSPAENFVGWFLAPWWNPTAPTLFTRSFADYLDYFYRILMPESSSLIISAVILTLPVQILLWRKRKELDKNILACFVILSLSLFYFQALSSFSLSDVSRLSLWTIPLWVPLALTVLQDINGSSSFRHFLPLFIGALVLLWVNIWLSREKGGVYVGYGLSSRLWTADAIMIQLIALIMILSLLFLKEDLLKARLAIRLAIGRRLPVIKSVNLRNTVFFLVVILILLNEVYFSCQFVEKSRLYEDHGLATINDALNDLANNGSLIFANNYIYMKPYVDDMLLQQGLLLPLPDTKEDFLKLLKVAPNNTLLLISDDDATTWYEYANKYIKNYVHSCVITPEKPDVSKLPRLNLTEPILIMTFDDPSETTVIDYSGFGNNGINHGADSVKGYYGRALRFNGKEYVSIPNNEILNVQNEITISFFAKIEEAEPLKGYMILSKGYAASYEGSYDVFIWNGEIYFELGGVGYLSISAEPYIGSWHHFIFTYNGEEMSIYVDGSLRASKPVSGLIRYSSYPLEIGRDSQRNGYYFVGLIDELQISNESLNFIDFVKAYFTHYAFLVSKVSLPNGQARLFRVINTNKDKVNQDIIVKSSSLRIDENYTITLEVRIETLKSRNVTILIGTDRFTKVYVTPLYPGRNDIKIQFDYIVDPSWYEPGGFYWLHLAQARLVVIDNNSIVYNKFITIHDLKLMNVFLLALLSGIFITCFIAFYNEKMRDIKMLRKLLYLLTVYLPLRIRDLCINFLTLFIKRDYAIKVAYKLLNGKALMGELPDGSLIFYPLDDFKLLSIISEIYHKKIYDVEGCESFKCVCDVGAHIGLFTLRVSKQAPNSKIIAIEPNPINFKFLVKNIFMNNLEDRVHALNVAVGKRKERSVFYLSKVSRGDSSLKRWHSNTGTLGV